MNADRPLVSCLMVTGDRLALARRAVECLARQTWPNKELVVVDDGGEDYGPMLDSFRDRLQIQYCKLEKREDRFLGGLRNVSLEEASGEFLMQWDDDEYYHPERISRQMEFLQQNDLDAVALRFCLMHLDVPELVNNPYRIDGIDGIPGTILHRKGDVRYPNQRRSEDTRYMEQLGSHGRLGTMETGSHLFIRCFHGANTWDRKHFFGKLKRTWGGLFHYWTSTLVYRDILRHPYFSLRDEERETVSAFLELSFELDLLNPARASQS